MVSFIQRFGSSLNRHLHYHFCVADGLFHLDSKHQLQFYELMMVSSVQLKQAEEEIRSRTIRLLQRHGVFSRQEARAMLGWSHSGFSLHCDVRLAAEDRLGLERLTRYCARPAFVSENLNWMRPGEPLTYTMKSGCKIHLSPLELIDKLAALIPPPRIHSHHYHGAFAPNSPLRPAVTACRPIPRTHSRINDVLLYLKRGKKKERKSRHPWAELIARIYEVFPLECTSCGGVMRLVSFITDPISIHSILSQLGLPTEPPALEKARAPPQMEFSFSKEVYREDIDLLIVCDEADKPFPEIVDPPHPEESCDLIPEENYDFFPEEVYVEQGFDYDQSIGW